MNETWLTLAPILFVDVLNPVLFAVMVYAVSTQRPIINSTAILLGHTLAYFSAGIIIALGLERIINRLENPHHIDFIISLLIGILLLWVTFSSNKKTGQQQNKNNTDLTPFKALGLGAIVNFVGIPFALPYFAVLDQILKADLAMPESLLILAIYNLLYALPFVIVPLLVITIGERSKPILLRINDSLERFSSFLMPVLLFLVGIFLISDAITYFVTGQGLV